MKNRKQIVAACLLAVTMLLCGCKEEAKTPEKISLGILEPTDRSAVKAYLEEKKLIAEQDYCITAENCSIYGYELLGDQANVEITFDGDRVLQMQAYFELFLHEFPEDTTPFGYSFTEEDQEQISKEINNLLEQLGQYLNCELTEYDLVPIIEPHSEISDPEKAFYEGMILREYSVRDRNGILWLLRYDAFNGMATATLYKIVDESGYENFLPIVDLTK